MDVFTDVEIFCDILEAANKRGVFVCVLLDQGGVRLFQEMCDKVQLSDRHLKVGAPRGAREVPCESNTGCAVVAPAPHRQPLHVAKVYFLFRVQARQPSLIL